MQAFDLGVEKQFDRATHVEKVLGTVADGDVTVACWEPGQCSPYHCHPEATEIYLCVAGGGRMRTPDTEVDINPGAFVVHPPGELHEYENGGTRTVLFRVRYGPDRSARTIRWRGNPDWVPDVQDRSYEQQHAEEVRAALTSTPSGDLG